MVLGLVDEAIAHCQQADKLCPDEDQKIKAAILLNMAHIIAQQGDIPQALQLYQQSLKLFERIGDVGGKATTLHNMADIIRQEDIDQALQLYQQSLELFERIGSVGGKASNLNNTAIILAQKGDIDQALQLYQQSLKLFESIGDVRGKAPTLHNMARIIAPSQTRRYFPSTAIVPQSLKLCSRPAMSVAKLVSSTTWQI